MDASKCSLESLIDLQPPPLMYVTIVAGSEVVSDTIVWEDNRMVNI